MKIVIDLYATLLTVSLAAGEYLPLILLQKKQRKKQKKYPQLSIIIPVKNEEAVIKQTLTSWSRAAYPNNKEIIVLDANSTDNTARIVQNYSNINSQVKLVKVNANNKLNTLLRGLKYAQYDYIVISDADKLPAKSALVQLVPFLNDNIGAVFGMSNLVENDLPFQKITSLEFLNIMLDMLFATNLDSAPYLVLHSCIMKKSLIEQLPEQNLIADDLYLAINIRKQNHKAIFIPQIEIGKEKVINYFDLLNKRLRTSSGTIQAAKSNYFGAAFNPKYGRFGMLVLPFRQITIVGANLLMFFLPIVFGFGLLFKLIVINYIIVFAILLYLLLLIAQIFRFIAAKKLFPKSAKTIPLWAIFVYPIYLMLIRKFLAGFAFLTTLLGANYHWKQSTSDR